MNIVTEVDCLLFVTSRMKPYWSFGKSMLLSDLTVTLLLKQLVRLRASMIVCLQAFLCSVRCYVGLLSVLTLRLENTVRHLIKFQLKTYVQRSTWVFAQWILTKWAHPYHSCQFRKENLTGTWRAPLARPPPPTQQQLLSWLQTPWISFAHFWTYISGIVLCIGHLLFDIMFLRISVCFF